MTNSIKQELVDMASVGERLKSRIDELGISVQALADAVGITIQAIHLVIRDPNAGMHSETAGKIAQHLGVNERWLVSGLGQKLRTDALKDHEVEMLETFRKLTPELQRAIVLMAKNMRNRGQ